MIQRRCESQRAPRRGFTLIEVTIVMTMAAVLTVMAVPSFRRSLERSRADLAAANLKAIWAAQQLYWLEYKTYTDDLAELSSLGLIDTTVVSGSGGYVFTLNDADAAAFEASATRSGSTQWTGTLSIDQTGALTGAIAAEGLDSIIPSLN